MNKNQKELITQLKTELSNDTILSYLKHTYTKITNNENDDDKYEKDFNLSILIKQKEIKRIANCKQNIIIEIYEYNIAPNGYFIVYNEFSPTNTQTNCEIFI